MTRRAALRPTSRVTRTLRTRNPPRPSVLPRPPDFRASTGAERRAAQGGQGAEDEAGEERNGEREEEDLGVQVDFLQAGKIEGSGGEEGAQSPVGEGHAEGSAGQREEEAFDQRLTEQACAAGAEGGADGGIAGASGGAGEGQVGEVDAEDEEHGADRRHEEDEALADVADHALLEGGEAGVEVEIAGDLLADGGLHDVELGLGFGGGDAGTEAGGGPVVEVAHVEFELVGLVAEGLVDFETISGVLLAELSESGEIKVGRQNADNFIWLAIEQNLAAQDSGVGLVAAAPECIGKDRDLVVAGFSSSSVKARPRDGCTPRT